jgi:RNA polymerase sigma-70 factor (sigma-E family)
MDVDSVYTEGDGFTQFVTRERPRLRRTAYLLCWEWHEAEDLVQEALIVVLRRWNHLDHPSAAGGYARRIIYRIYIDNHRHVRWGREALQATMPDATGTDVDDDTIADRLILSHALRQLPPRQRAAVVLRYFEDLDVAQTAEVLACKPATIRSQTARALATMRTAISKYP